MRSASPRVALLALLLVVLSTLVAGTSRVKVQPGELDKEGRPTVSLSIDPAEGFTYVSDLKAVALSPHSAAC